MEADRSALNQTDGWAARDIVNCPQDKQYYSRNNTQGGRRNFRIAQGRSYHYHSAAIIRNRMNMHGNCFAQPPGGFGKGPTVLLFKSVVIVANPPLPPDALIQMELIEKTHILTP